MGGFGSAGQGSGVEELGVGKGKVRWSWSKGWGSPRPALWALQDVAGPQKISEPGADGQMYVPEWFT